MKTLIAMLVLCSALGCDAGAGDPGGTGGRGQPPPPSSHEIDSGGAVRIIKTGQTQQVGPFHVPDGATVTYQITDMPSGVGEDSMQIGIATDATAAASNPTEFSSVTGSGSTTQTTPALAAGSYDLLVTCANLLDECIFTDEISAFY